MPTLSIFFGIIITMYYDEHNPPHIHATYSEYQASFSFEGEILKGSLPNRQRKLVEAWIEIHREELETDWVLAIRGEQLFKIKPLS